MDTPLEIAFHNMDSSNGLEARIRERAAKLERFHNHITSCHVVVEVPNRSQGGAKGYHVRVECRVPGKELVVSHDRARATSMIPTLPCGMPSTRWNVSSSMPPKRCRAT